MEEEDDEKLGTLNGDDPEVTKDEPVENPGLEEPDDDPKVLNKPVELPKLLELG